MYTPIVLPSDLNSALYPEIQNEITRNDGGAIATEAIDTAIQEAKMYLSRYDIIQLFGDKDNDIAAIFSDNYLKRMIKDIAIWHLLQLANPNMLYEGAKGRYDEAIASLRRIQMGKADPKWPYQDTTGENAPPSDQVTIRRNPLRNVSGYPPDENRYS